MSDIATFLLDRIAEDEAAALAALGPDEPAPPPARMADQFRLYLGGEWGEHAARWTMHRVLAECQAKRAIVEDVRGYCWEGRESGPPCGRCGRIGCRNLQLLASVYADHPDFREEWRA